MDGKAISTSPASRPPLLSFELNIKLNRIELELVDAIHFFFFFSYILRYRQSRIAKRLSLIGEINDLNRLNN